MGKQSFIRGTLILLIAGVITRILGFVPRITLPRIIGSEGVGLYQMGYPFLIVILTIIIGGIPLAIAKLVAEAMSEGNEKRARNILSISLTFTISMSILFTLICLLAAPWITSHLLTDQRVYYTFLSMCPMIMIIAISSVYRGYFQGLHNMIPTAVSQVVETLIRIVAMLILAYLMLPYGIEYAAAGAMLGVGVGEVGGMLVTLIYYRSNKTVKNGDPPSNKASEFRRLLSISIPVTASRLVGSFSYLFESVMIVQSLAIAGVATTLATSQYGQLQGMIIPILLLPTALTYSLAVSLVPSLSEAAARNDMRTIHKRLNQSIKLALVTGAPFAVIMYVLAHSLCFYLYRDAEVGGMLQLMAPVALLLYCQAPLQATLQALEKPGTALLNTFIGSAIKLVLITLLVTNPHYGIYGAIIAINVNIILVTLLHWNSVSRLLSFSMKMSDFIKIATGIAVMGICTHFIMAIHWNDQPLIRFITACLVGGMVYLIVIFQLNLIDSHDFQKILPFLSIKKRPR